MIQKLHLQNYQSHKDSTFVFVPGVNIILGRSDSGKTAALRALRWVQSNRPTGDAFRSNWGGDTEVTITATDTTIKRAKGKSKNYYELDSEIFKAMGTDVPAEIKSTLNLNEINLQAQFDRPFLLDASPGEVAVHFNKIAHIDQINSSLSKVNQWINKISSDITVAEHTAKQASVELKQFSNLEKLEAEVEVLEGLQKELEQKQNYVRRLSPIISAYKTVEAKKAFYEKILTLEEPFSKLILLGRTNKKNKETVASLTTLVLQIQASEHALEKATKLQRLEKTLNPILEKEKTVEDYTKTRGTINRLMKDIELAEKNIDIHQGLLTKKEKEFQKEFPDVCPLCNQKVNKTQL